jgi:methylamine dehydrogenase accessory protein MauD
LSFPFDLSYAALWGLVIFQSLVLLGLLREAVETRRKLAELPAGGAPGGRLPLGSEAPDFSAVEAHGGRTVRLGDLAGRRSILLFLSPGCRNCEKLAAAIHGIYHKAEGRLYLVCQGSRQECIAFLRAHDPGMRLPLLLDPELAISFQFRVAGTPAAVLLDAELRIRSYGSPRRSEELAEMMAEAAADRAASPAEAMAGGG